MKHTRHPFVFPCLFLASGRQGKYRLLSTTTNSYLLKLISCVDGVQNASGCVQVGNRNKKNRIQISTWKYFSRVQMLSISDSLTKIRNTFRIWSALCQHMCH